MPNYRSVFRYQNSTQYFSQDVTCSRSCDAWDSTKNALSVEIRGSGQNPEDWKKHAQSIVTSSS